MEEEDEDAGTGRWAERILNESGVGSTFEDDERDDEDYRFDDEAVGWQNWGCGIGTRLFKHKINHDKSANIVVESTKINSPTNSITTPLYIRPLISSNFLKAPYASCCPVACPTSRTIHIVV